MRTSLVSLLALSSLACARVTSAPPPQPAADLGSLTVVIDSEMTSIFRLVRVDVAIDGEAQIALADAEHRTDLSRRPSPATVHKRVAPGEHEVSVHLVYEGVCTGIYSYCRSVHFDIQSRHTLEVPGANAVELHAVAYEKGSVTTPVEERPAIRFRVGLNTVGCFAPLRTGTMSAFIPWAALLVRKIPGVRRASIKEVEALSKLPWVRDEALSDRMFEVRLLPDGRVLQYLSDSDPGTLFPSREVLVEMRREIAERFAKEPVDLTRTLLPPIDDFLRDVEAHARSLGERIRVPDEALDRTPASLDAVDAALRRIPKAKRETREIVTPLVAYVGFVMLGGCDGRWTKAPVRPHVTGNENEPMIMGRDGRILQPYAVVYLPMVEPSRRIPLRAAVDVYLLPYRVGSSAGSDPGG